MIIESFSENDDDIIFLRMIIEIVSKEMMMVSFPENDYRIVLRE